MNKVIKAVGVASGVAAAGVAVMLWAYYNSLNTQVRPKIGSKPTPALVNKVPDAFQPSSAQIETPFELYRVHQGDFLSEVLAKPPTEN